MFVDYATHAEQAAILNALRQGFDPTGGTIYVLGFARTGPYAGKLTTRRTKVFICKKCPRAMARFNIKVCIPHIDGWAKLTADEATDTANKYCGKGYWDKFIMKKAA